ncbi:unnamed protein product [Calypogeia fissa]
MTEQRQADGRRTVVAVNEDWKRTFLEASRMGRSGTTGSRAARPGSVSESLVLVGLRNWETCVPSSLADPARHLQTVRTMVRAACLPVVARGQRTGATALGRSLRRPWLRKPARWVSDNVLLW